MISKKCKYGLKALLILGEEYSHKKPILISYLVQKERIPRKFLEFILLELKNSGFLQSKMGKGGGYFLAKPPAKISLGAVIRTLDGPLAPVPCLSQTAYRKCEECRDEATCPIRAVFKEVREATVKILDGTSLQDMLDQSGAAKNVLEFSI